MLTQFTRSIETCLVVEEFDGTEVILDPFSEDLVFSAGFGTFVGDGSADVSIEPEIVELD